MLLIGWVMCLPKSSDWLWSFSQRTFICLNQLHTDFHKPSATQSRLLITLYKTAFKNIVEKGENAGHQHFLLLPQCFQLFPKQIQSFIWSSEIKVNLDQRLKFCCLAKSECI